MNRVSRILIAITVALSGGIVGATPAAADTGMAALEQLDAAVRATTEGAGTGIDVIQTATFDRAGRLRTFTPRMDVPVSAGTRLRVHATVNPDASYYLSVRTQPSGRLVGAAGRQPGASPPWGTVSMLEKRPAGVSAGTALTGLPDDAYFSELNLPDNPRVVALRLLLPPYASSFDEGWSDVVSTTRPDGRLVISGNVRAGVPASDGEERCTWPSVRVVVGPDGVISSSRWVQSCPGQGTREFRSVAVYGPQPIQPPTRPQLPASTVLD
jgi:hypothetical protein